MTRTSITRLSHDPAYIAEHLHSGTFRFSYGVIDEGSGFGAEIQDAQREEIVDLWDREFREARKLLGSLYSRVLKKCKASATQAVGKDEFDSALRA